MATRWWRVVRAAAVAGAVALVVAGCSGGTDPGGRGSVTLLTHSSFAASPDVLAEFTARTGYEVRLVQPGDAGLALNEAILRKDAPVADVFFGIDNTFLTRAFDAGIFEPYAPPGLDLDPGVPADPQQRVTPIDRGDVCIDYDKEYFDQPGRPPAPTSFASLVDPRYEGLTVVENPATSSPGLAFLLATIAAQGDPGWKDYWRQLRANGVRVVDDWTAAYQTDFTAGGGPGDRPIVVSYGSSPPADVVYSDPPRAEPRVGVVESTCFRQYEYAGVLRGAKNQAGAKALVDFLASARFQSDMPLQMFVDPVVAGAEVPAEYRRWAVAPERPLTMTPEQIGANREEWVKEWSDIVVR